jgi:hypothetical protein
MKIDVKYNDLKTKFADLEPGDTFAYNGTIFMKILDVERPTGTIYNAVKLGTGELYTFTKSDCVNNVRVVTHTGV